MSEEQQIKNLKIIKKFLPKVGQAMRELGIPGIREVLAQGSTIYVEIRGMKNGKP